MALHRTPALLLAALTAIAVLVAASVGLQPSPHTLHTPGAAQPVRFEAEARQVGLRWRFTTVASRQLTWAEYGWYQLLDIAPGSERPSPALPAAAAGAKPLDSPEADAAAMDTSKRTAWSLATEALGYRPVPAGGSPAARPVLGAEVLAVAPGSPAARGGLERGDIVVAVDGVPVRSVSDVATDATGPARLTVWREGHERQALVRASRPGRFGLEVMLTVAVEPRVAIDSGDVGGPSAGLVFTLAYLDLLAPGSLANGMVVAGTGSIHPNGIVGEVGGVPQKVAAAILADADVFFVPARQADEARKSAAGHIAVVPVAHYLDAIAWLCDRGSPSACELLPRAETAVGTNALPLP